MMTFGIYWLRPLWLIVIPLLFVLLPLLWKHRRQAQGWHQVIAPHLAKRLLRKQNNASNKGYGFLIMSCAAVIITIALAGPAVDQIETPVMAPESGHVIVLDNSMHTRARDVSPDRHSQLKFKVRDFIAQISEGQTGLVIYAGDAFTVTPLTSDKENLLYMLEPIAPELMTTQGNDPLLAMEEADRLLKQAGYQHGHIVWFTAGITERDMVELRQFFRGNSHRVSILASGTREGAPVQTADGELLRDERGQVVLTRLYREYLERISRETSGIFLEYSTNQSDIEQLIHTIETEDPDFTTQNDFMADEWRDLGPYIALLLIPFVLFAARRNVVIALMPMALLAEMPTVHANTNTPDASQNISVTNPVRKPFLNKEQQAEEMYRAGDYASAAALSNDPMRKGQAFYRLGQYEDAVREFAMRDTAEAHYNRANSLAHAGQLNEAIQAYEQALEHRPSWTEANENKALVEQLQNQEQQNNENGETSPEHDSESESEQNSDQQQNDPGSNDSPEDSQQPPQQSESDDSQSQDSMDQENAAGDEPDPAESAAAESEDVAAMPDPEQSLTEEEQREIEQLMRRLDHDPAILLRNRMLMESQRRRTTSPPPRGGR